MSDKLEIMSKDVVVARWGDKHLEVLRQDLLPLFLRRVASVDEWLKTRAVDEHRTNSRLLKRALRLAENNDIAAVLHAHGATITDTYWVRKEGSNITYADVKFKDNQFAELALHGKGFADAVDSKQTHTPELTNTGSFEKCWKRRNNQWVMIKSANENEAFSEVFVSRLCQALGVPVAVYNPNPSGVETVDFTNGAMVNFEPALTFVNDSVFDGDYETLYNKIVQLCPNAGQSFANMIFIDAVCYNVDRHLGNLGVMRDPDTGIVLSMAPLFDHNLALISRDTPIIGRSDMLISDFVEFVYRHPEYVQGIPWITNEMMQRVLADTPYNVDKDYVRSLVLSRQELIQQQYRELVAERDDPDEER